MKKLLQILILTLMCFSGAVFAQSPIQEFWSFNQNKRGTRLLDQITTTASMAYSVRRLRTTYAGPAMSVRRGTGTTLAIGDVAFSGASGAVDANSIVTITSAGTASGLTVGSTMAFNTFYSGVSVYVTTWYDQSGNARNVTQSTEGKQPRIVNAGVLETSNTKASIQFTGSGAQILQVAAAPTSILGSGYIGTASAVLEASATSGIAFGFAPNGSARWQNHINYGQNFYFDVGSGAYSRYLFNNSANEGLLRTYIMIASATAPRIQVFLSGNAPASPTISGTPTALPASMTTFNIGGIDFYHTGHQSEVIIFPVALSTANVSTLNANQKLFYNTP